MPVQTIENRRLYRQVADQIEAMIAAGAFAPGARRAARTGRAIEGGVAALAAANATEAEIDALREALDLTRREQAGGADTEEGDRQFHLKIARATHNALLLRTVTELWDWMRGPMWTRLNDNLYMRANRPRRLAHHERVLEAIRNRDAEAAQTAMRAHLAQVKEQLLNVVDQNG